MNEPYIPRPPDPLSLGINEVDYQTMLGAICKALHCTEASVGDTSRRAAGELHVPFHLSKGTLALRQFQNALADDVVLNLG